MTVILLVEDNPLNQEMLSRRLIKKGFEVIYAQNGIEAIQQTKALRPDLILMDLSLPEMDGWQATKHLKQDPQLAHIPVIALTAHAMAGDREKALEMGCNEYATKPIDFSGLYQKIQAQLKADPQANA